MSEQKNTESFGPDWRIELEQRSSRTWILHVTNSGSVASSFVPLGLSIVPSSELQIVKTLTLRALNSSPRIGAPPSAILNPGERMRYELWIALAKENEPLQGDSVELKMVLNYLRPTIGVESTAGQGSELLTLSIHHPGWNIHSSAGDPSLSASGSSRAAGTE